jgi:hypothetical protein
MFHTLKQKIAKETGTDVSKLDFNKTSTSSKQANRLSISSNHSTSFDSSKDDIVVEGKDVEELLSAAQKQIEALENEKKSLTESLQLMTHNSKTVYDENDFIQCTQQEEIQKLKNLLLFREQVNGILSYSFIVS